MLNFFAWYLLVTFLGWLTFPLAWRLFPALADRGYSLARALGMLVWGFVFWLLASLGVIQNDGGGLLLALLVLAGLSAWAFWAAGRRQIVNDGKNTDYRPLPIVQWIKSNLRMVITVEVVFFLAFAFLAFVRACNPEATGTEKPMEMAFINAILRSPTFPPHDPWLSGYAISYYHFGYVMTAMLAKATGTLGSVAFNLMLALVFALSTVGAYGIIYNLLAVWRARHPSPATRPPSLFTLPLLGPFFLLIVSNLEGFLEVLHRYGVFWKFNADGLATSSFWGWLNMLDLNQPPFQPLGGLPDRLRYWWWWRASRVVTDYTLSNAHIEIIDEFPAFSYLLGDLHPHILAMPFGLLAVAVALNLFLGGWKGETDFGVYKLSISPIGVIFSGLLVGGLAFLNTWDILIGLALLVGAYVLAQALENGWTWRRLADAFAFAVPIIILMVLLYLPFYAGFSSQAGGILPNLEFPTRGAHLWVMFGSLFLPVMAYLVYLRASEKRPARWLVGFGFAAGFGLLLWIFSWLLAVMIYIKMPDFAKGYLAGAGFTSIAPFFQAAFHRRLVYIGGFLTIVGLIGAALAYLLRAGGRKENTEGKTQEDESSTTDTSKASTSAPIHPSSFILHPSSPTVNHFVLLLIVLGALLILAPDFVFLRDQFGNRMNTIFKFYYQAWLMLSLAAAFGVAVMLQNLRGAWDWVYRIGLTLVLLMALAYPVLGLLTKTNEFQINVFKQNLSSARAAGDPSAIQTAARVWTLDGGAFFRNGYGNDMAAADWLRTAPYGILVEAVGGSYSDYAHISIYSGLPNVLGWPGHEGQWRGGSAEQVSQVGNINCQSADPSGPRMRSDDIRCLYETNNWEDAQVILSQYNIRYVFIGALERSTYHINETKLQAHLKQVFQAGDVVIYEIP